MAGTVGSKIKSTQTRIERIRYIPTFTEYSYLLSKSLKDSFLCTRIRVLCSYVLVFVIYYHLIRMFYLHNYLFFHHMWCAAPTKKQGGYN